MTVDTVEVHCAPLPDGHREAADCWCGPLRSSLSDEAGELWIHRSDPPAFLTALEPRP